MSTVDASALIPMFLYQGGAAPPGSHVRDAGFDVLVLCAKEHQPPAEAFPGVEVLHCPMNDSVITPWERELAQRTARQVAQALAANKRVLSTCYMGWNRSGLISGLAMTELGLSPERIVRIIRKARGPRALSNRSFLGVIAGQV